MPRVRLTTSYFTIPGHVWFAPDFFLLKSPRSGKPIASSMSLFALQGYNSAMLESCIISSPSTACPMPSDPSISAVVTGMHRSKFHAKCWPMIHVDLSKAPTPLLTQPLSLARLWSSPSPLSSSAVRTYQKDRLLPSIRDYALSQNCCSVW